MSPEAFRFYLPAYIRIAVESFETADVVADAAVFSLTPPRENERLFKIAAQAGGPGPNPFSPEHVQRQRVWWLERVAGLAGPQQRSIAMFLQYMDEARHSTGSKEALEYWTRG